MNALTERQSLRLELHGNVINSTENMKKLWNCWKILAFLMLTCLTVISSCEKPSFRILAPDFICGRPKSDNSNESGRTVPQQITIGLQTKGGQRLHYNVTVQFSLLNGFISQRHTLSLWASIRKLEKRLHKEREMISTANQIIIRNDELVPGVGYSFQVVGIDQTGAVSQEQNFTLTYRGRNLPSSVIQDGSSSTGDVSLLLLGSEVMYPNLPFTVTAKVIFCEPRNDYKFKWNISDPTIASIVLQTNSDVFEMPAGTLSSGKSYDIGVTVLELVSGTQLVSVNMKLNVLTRVLEGNIFPAEASAGFAQTTEFRTIFNDPKAPNLKWHCDDTLGDTSCSEDLIPRDWDASISFMKESNYTVSASTEGVELNSKISVNSKSTISVTLRTLPLKYLQPGQRYEFTAEVQGLVPKCTINWTVVKAEGFSYFDSTVFGGLGGIVINDIEENFLSELVDYGNDTLSREVTLVLPSNAPKWKGLEPDAVYKFRLVTQCPEPIDDGIEAQAARRNVTSYWDMIMKTNALPKGQPLKVIPNENGTALSTFFIFTTGMAKDRQSDYPLRYSYWYATEGNSVNFASYYEVMSAETQLPYSKYGVSTFYEVCDTRNACARIDGPKVSPQMNPLLTQTTVDFYFDAIENSFLRGNIHAATKEGFNVLITLKNQNSASLDEVHSKMMKLFENQTPLIKKAFVEKSRYLLESSVLQFVQQVKIMIDMGPKGLNDRLLAELLELIDSVERGPVRKVRAVEAKAIVFDTTETKLALFEGLINSPNGTEESKNSNRAKLLDYIPKAVQQLCANDKKYAYSSGLVTIEVMKMSSKLRKPLLMGVRIPENQTNPQYATVKSSDEPKMENSSVSFLCLGKIWYQTDLLTSQRRILAMYQVLLMTDASEKLAEWKDGQYLWNISLAVGKDSKLYKCELWNREQKWTDKLCTSTPSSGLLECNCSQLSFLRIVPWIEDGSKNNVTMTTALQTAPSTAASSIFIQPTDKSTGSDMLTFAPLSTETIATTTLMETTIASTLLATTIATNSSTDAPSLALTTQSPSTDSTTFHVPNITQPSQPNISNPTTISSNATLKEAEELKANATQTHREGGTTGPLGYSIIGALILCTALTAAAVILYRRRRHTTSLAEELHGIASRVRSQSLPVRYARFQDEHNMSGDNVSTISDTVTI